MHTIEQLQVVTEPQCDIDIVQDTDPQNLKDTFSLNEEDKQLSDDIEALLPAQRPPIEKETAPAFNHTQQVLFESNLEPDTISLPTNQERNLHVNISPVRISSKASPSERTRVRSEVQRVGKWDKEKLRDWMVAKRKERLVEFREQKDSLRKKEKHPYNPPKPVSESIIHTVQLCLPLLACNIFSEVPVYYK